MLKDASGFLLWRSALKVWQSPIQKLSSFGNTATGLILMKYHPSVLLIRLCYPTTSKKNINVY